MTLLIYSFGLFMVLVLGLPYWLFRLITAGKYREGLPARLGRIPAHLCGGKRTIWVHAVSVGEVIAVSRLVKDLAERFPELRVVLSTTTRSGQRLARERVGADRIFYFPLDFAWIVERYLKCLRPVLLVLVETEFWPNLLAKCGRASVPVALVNARISDRSFPRYLRLRFLWKPILSNVSLFLAQSEGDMRRLRAIGARSDSVRFGGNFKFDVRNAETAPITTALRAHLPEGARVLVCGSTLEGEEECLLDAFCTLQKTFPSLVMILAPRHPERFAKVAELLRTRRLPTVLRSSWILRPAALAAGSIVLLDSIGELGSVYSLASIAFVGGSLVPSGGHNPLEPAQFAVPIVVGPFYENFRAIVDPMLEGQALKVAACETIAPTWEMLLRDEEAANLLGARALEFFDRHAGATERVLTALLDLLPAQSEAARGQA